MQAAEKTVATFEALKGKIETKTARVGIVGLGYVGLPLAVEFAKAGFDVTGIDVQRRQRSTDSIAAIPTCRTSPRRRSPKLVSDRTTFGRPPIFP